MAMAHKASRAGATAGGSRGGVGLYLQRHAQTFVASLGRLWRTPFASLMTVLVIGVALAMPALLQMLVQNAVAATGNWDNAVDLSVYLDRVDPTELLAEEGEGSSAVAARVASVRETQRVRGFRAYHFGQCAYVTGGGGAGFRMHHGDQ